MMTKTFEEFAEALKKDMEDRMLWLTFEFGTVPKLNGESYRALRAMANTQLGLCENLDRAYECCRHGMAWEELLKQTEKHILKVLNVNSGLKLDIEGLHNYETARPKLLMEAVAPENNTEILQTIPHRNWEDLALVYRLRGTPEDSDTDEIATVLVTNELLKHYGITEEQLFADALAVAREKYPIEIRGIGSMLIDVMRLDKDDPMYRMLAEADACGMSVVTTPGNLWGASALFYPEFAEKAAEWIGGSYLVIPSSIDELLLIPDNGHTDVDELRQTIEDINNREVRPEDILSYSVYRYDAEKNTLKIAE